MIRLILLILIFFVALTISPQLVDEKGYILIAMGNFTIESTVVSALIMAIVALLAITIIIILLRSSARLTTASWRKIAFNSKKRARKEFEQGLSAYIMQDYVQAEHLMVKCAEDCEHPISAWLVAANAAFQLQNYENAKHYLSLIEVNNNSKPIFEAMALKVDCLLAQHDIKNAREFIDANHTLIGHNFRFLTADIKVALAEKRYLAVIENLTLARKEQTISAEQINLWQSEAYTEHMRSLYQQNGTEALINYWQSINRKLKKQNTVIIAFATVLSENKLTEQFIDLLHPIIKKDADEELLMAIAQMSLGQIQPLIAEIQKHREKYPENTKWLRGLAHITAQVGDWHVAESAFNDLFAIENNTQDFKIYGWVLENLAHHKEANQAYRKS